MRLKSLVSLLTFVSFPTRFGMASRPGLPFFILCLASWSYLSNFHLQNITAKCDVYSYETAEPLLRANETASTSLRTSPATDSLSVAWLMSFPNSGTSYTSQLVRTVTGTNTAANYAAESRRETMRSGRTFAVFRGTPGGPFWTDAHSNTLVRPTTGYVLTKTHCGSFCNNMNCPVGKYVASHQTFTRQCLTGNRFKKEKGEKPKLHQVSYSKDLVKRAVHVIRDPFDNVVSRFHLAYNQFVEKNQREQMALYPKSKDGFLAFCEGQKQTYGEEEMESEAYRDVLEYVGNIPCYADFYRYIQWHNLALATTWDMDIPSMILHYENYTDNFEQTKTLLLGFLEQEDLYEPPLFVTGKKYREYFTETQVQAVSSMFSELALARTLDLTKHYFAPTTTANWWDKLE